MVEATSRLGLPMLVAGQGQKDVTHNEALAAVDVLLHPAVRSRGVSEPPADADLGACWLVPAGAGGAWTDRAGAVACWTAGGWRFQRVPEGGSVWILDEAARVRLAASGWVLDMPWGDAAPTVNDPVGGAAADLESRAAIVAVLGRLRQLGLLAS